MLLINLLNYVTKVLASLVKSKISLKILIHDIKRHINRRRLIIKC
jgi:hypothetical protein